jgi:hypothetical protein
MSDDERRTGLTLSGVLHDQLRIRRQELDSARAQIGALVGRLLDLTLECARNGEHVRHLRAEVSRAAVRGFAAGISVALSILVIAQNAWPIVRGWYH